jgi:hypothetical protein
LDARRLLHEHGPAGLPGPVPARGGPTGVREQHVRLLCRDVPGDPHGDRPRVARSGVHLFAAAHGDGLVLPREDPPERDPVRRDGRGHRQQRQPEHARPRRPNDNGGSFEVPIKTDSFYDVYRNGENANTGGPSPPGAASGGFCAVAGADAPAGHARTRLGVGLGASVLVAVALARARRRRRRR